MDKYIIKKSEIVLVALIYNYIANGKNCLSEDRIIKFIETINENLRTSNDKFLIDIEENVEDYYFDYHLNGIEYDKNTKIYTIKEITDYMIRYYDNIPHEIITATLNKYALFTIYVDKNKLKLKKEYIHESGIEDIYSLEAQRAKAITKKHLEADGCKNIEIELAIPDQLDTDKGYHVSYKCERPFEKVNIIVKQRKK